MNVATSTVLLPKATATNFAGRLNSQLPEIKIPSGQNPYEDLLILVFLPRNKLRQRLKSIERPKTQEPHNTCYQ